VVGLDHVQVAGPPGCEPAARAFYGKLLGLEEIPKPDGVRASGGVWFGIGRTGQELHIGIQEPFAAAIKAHPGLLVSAAGYEALLERVGDAGFRVTRDHRIAGVTRCFVSDPWGNRLELRASRSPRSPGA
jgi:catechol 2,3-dioxygenase-like lactoylglutathione lyase family enzyme